MTTTNKSNQPIDPPATTTLDYDSEDEDDDDDTVVGTCLHCNCPPPPRSERGPGGSSNSFSCTPCPATDPNASSVVTREGEGTRVQVSCDDCRSFICDGCHWCHEFQANHEIRVCDRCDAFYCRTCDEMDQCEDCSEVVCNTCSTLMSCKFCGCGLCEDCATACGRCGIVLCARDAKFAVECDTCKMSYCLVCLASGTKDPCVRCGHRPSKRVEQLVHLRLKSIYKAFKQSGASGGPMDGGMPMENTMNEKHSSSGGRDHSSTSTTYKGKYSSALRSLTENESLRNASMEGSTTNFDQSMASEVAAVLQTASSSMSDVGEDGRRSRGRRVMASHPPPPFSIRPRRSTSPIWRKTREEIEAANAAAEASANAAAAALLAELDEEETNGASKKSKKKKKKKEKKKEAAAVTEAAEKAKEDEPPAEEAKSNNFDSKSVASNKKQDTKASFKSVPTEDDSSDEEEMILEQLVKTSKPPKKERQKEEKKEAPPPVVEPPTSPPPVVEGTPDLDRELAELISNNDEAGLEDFLANLKGVPGLSVLRKATKKALKKMKDAQSPPEAKPPKQKAAADKDGKASKKEKVTHEKSTVSSGAHSSTHLTPASTAGSQHGPLLKVVSRTQSAVGTSAKGGAANTKSVPASARAECVMHMAPTVVGWVIGKGGQRIRDMMEESGAKIWIDQESMGDNDARVVYVSGKRANVDTAVRMVKDLISKAPVSASAVTVPDQESEKNLRGSSTANRVPSKSPSPALPVSSATESSSSFAAAAASNVPKQPATSPAPAQPPKQAVARKASTTPVWSNADSNTASHQPLKAAAPAPKPPPQAIEHSVDDSSKSIASMMNAMQPPVEIVRSEINCDPQFIALLLGRDGLAAKSIQTESGATLHINQTIAPGKIGISGRSENVKKAEQLIHGVMKYREDQLRQEAAQRASAASVSNMRPELNQGADPYARSANVSSMPSMQLHNLQRPQEDLQFQHQRPPQIPMNSGMSDRMNLPPGYDTYQRPPSFGSSDENLLQRQSPLQRLSPLPLPPRQAATSSMMDQNRHPQQQEQWGQMSQAHPSNRFSQFSNSQQISGNSNIMRSNMMYAPANNKGPQSTMSSMAPAFSSIPDPNPSYLQNLDASRRASTATIPQGRISDFLNQGNTGQHDSNEWGASNGTGEDRWSQSQASPQAARSGIRPDFVTQHSMPHESAPSLSDNLFRNQHAVNTHSTLANQAGNAKIDDSKFVDNMFNSLGEHGQEGDGLLDSLNNMSLGGLQQGGTWGSALGGGWGGILPNGDSSSLLDNNRRGNGFDSNFSNHSQR